MIFGIGVDIMNISRIQALSPDWDDSFFVKTFTKNERRQAVLTADPSRYFAGRFSGKEAVFKSLEVSSDVFRLNEVEIINDDEGRPCVSMFGKVKQTAKEKGIGKVFISLSNDGNTVIAFVISEFTTEV